MESMLKTLIVVTLVYYLIKGLIYLLLWQATYKVQENALAAKNKRKKKKDVEESVWAPDQEDES
jgi:cytoskeletal protein RodZ